MSKTKTKKTNSKTETKVVKKAATVSTPQPSLVSLLNSDEKISIRKSYALMALAGLIVAGIAGAYYWRTTQIVARVNGVPVTRQEYLAQLEKQGGKPVLENLITQRLIEQKAQSEGVTVATEEIDKEIADAKADFEGRGQTLEQVLALQGMTETSLREQIRLQKLLSKLAGTKEDVTQEEIDAYAKENADFIPEGMTEEETQEFIKNTLLNESNQQAIQTYIADLQSQGNIEYLND